MYDTETRQLIIASPQIDGLDRDRLPELLTEAYVEIAALRLRAGTDRVEGDTLTDTTARLRMLADILEIYAALSPEKENRDSAAFVAATAHQLIAQIWTIADPAFEQRLFVSARAISPSLSAALLFLAAGYPADASEAMRPIRVPAATGDYTPLLRALRGLCLGDLQSILDQTLVVPEGDSDVQAEFALWSRILEVLKLIGTRFLSGRGSIGEGTSIESILNGIRAASTQAMSFPAEYPGLANVFSAFAGPHHVATLLLAAYRGLDGSGLIDAPSPRGPAPDSWSGFIANRATTRPFLWTNHMSALNAGLANAGTSGVITFPTGAGKSTLSELKIAATLLTGRKVLYIAPTLALVSQVTKNLKDLLPEEQEIISSDIDDQLYAVLDTSVSGNVWVMTPERCLLVSTILPDEFSEVGLIVFDECHAIHMTSADANSRSVDAMLCLLRLLEIAPDADVLLMSAMMSNGPEIAAWLESACGKSVLAFDAAWKPTRQARASVIFEKSDIEDLQRILANSQILPDNSRRQNKLPNLPHKQMVAKPHLLVCLQQTWKSNDGEDYRIVDFVDDIVQLKADRDQYLRPHVKTDTSNLARHIANHSAKKGLKSIIFFHTPASVPSSVRESGNEDGVTDLTLTVDEAALHRALTAELGGSEFVYMPNSLAGGHHGQLLPYERDLVEGAFLRADGIKILYSTNTLAQGMNLPADQVIIVRTSSYDADRDVYRALDAHELLNAAGRAGRAGHAANGMVVVIPNDIVTYDNQNGRIGGYAIGVLKNDVLAQDDRCLKVSDPIDYLLDQCLLAPTVDNALVDSFVLRLPPPSDTEDQATVARRFFSRSLAAYKAQASGTSAVFDEKVDAAVRRRTQIIGDNASRLVETICSGTGLLPRAAESLIERLSSIDSPDAMTPAEWVRWVGDWLSSVPDAVGTLRGANLSYGDQFYEAIELWTTGYPLKDIELALGTPEAKLGYLKSARNFVKNVAREVSYLVGILAQVAAATELPNKDNIERYASTAASLLREGFDTLDKLILYQQMRDRLWTRVITHQRAKDWLSLVQAPNNTETETIEDLKRRVMRGIRRYEARNA